MKGTPKNLAQAIKNALSELHNTDPDDENFGHAIKFLHPHIRDFLAQKFQAAKFLAHQNCFSTEKDLQLLFDACTLDNPPLVIKETNND